MEREYFLRHSFAKSLTTNSELINQNTTDKISNKKLYNDYVDITFRVEKIGNFHCHGYKERVGGTPRQELYMLILSCNEFTFQEFESAFTPGNSFPVTKGTN